MTTPREKFRWPRTGTCRCCGCTDDNACPGNCWWVRDRAIDAPIAIPDQTLCSTCAGTDLDMVYCMEWIVRLVRRYTRKGAPKAHISRTVSLIAAGAGKRWLTRDAGGLL